MTAIKAILASIATAMLIDAAIGIWRFSLRKRR